ncbi:hypothetical protein P5G51_000890 [Virgibacillus sp. 179-BFC.A HS]|uniref:Response regulatory domain-containing protein n=1 Tax=Tigheibacillus jepli TaxID=3035914 RepID=A0ABU5CF19_9BACI|nr:hypothetical protein [Virgibacillus sp. 179-BFC.A HS]MDY0404153.1 hypothetical protein [Virgibacillus sp. 179-BFC.A HS]
MKINVLIIAPNTIVRQGLLMLLDADEGIRAHAADPKPESMLHEAKRFRPDIAIFPVYAYDREVLTAVRKFQKAFPDVKILLLLSELDEFLVMDSLQAGVDGILLDENNTDEKRLVENLRYLYEDGYVLTGKIAKLMMNNFNAMYASEKQQLRRRLLTHGIHVSGGSWI